VVGQSEVVQCAQKDTKYTTNVSSFSTGDPFYVNCVEDNFSHLGECSGLMICVGEQSTNYDILSEYIPQRFFNVMDFMSGLISDGFANGHCNVVAQESYGLASKYVERTNYTGDYVIGSKYYTKEPLSMVTRVEDPVFSDFVNAVLQAVMTAEKYGLTKADADTFPQTNLFGEEYRDMFRHALRFGWRTWGEYMDRFFENHDDEGEMDAYNDGTTGLLFTHPFGSLSEKDGRMSEGRNAGPTRRRIRERGKLLCGIRVPRPGFAMELQNTTNSSSFPLYEGIEIDLCRAIAASFFYGDTSAVEYVIVHSPGEGFIKLVGNEIDVLAGATWNLENDVREKSTGIGFSFTQPYFYGYSAEEDNFCLATMQDDHDWYSFVAGIVEAIIYAEENDIDAYDSYQMPEIALFGDDLRRMFRDAILEVGNYAELYERNIEPVFPRTGRNLLNRLPRPGPQHYLIPGII